MLITKEADLNIKNNDGQTPLDIASGRNRKDIVELLLAKGAKASSIYTAATIGSLTSVKVFIEKGTNINSKNQDGNTPLHYAARSRDAGKDIIELLIASGADVNDKNNKGQSPLDIAASRNRKDIVELLIAKGATISSIHVAAQIGDFTKVKESLEEGTDVNAKDGRGYTPFHYAIWYYETDIARFLIEKGADLHAKDQSGYTLLHWAVMMDNKELTELILAKGADVNTRGKAGETPLDFAMYVGKAIGQLLVEKGAEVSSLQSAAFIGDLAKVNSFLDEGVDVNAKNDVGVTALQASASGGHKEVAELLIAKGSDINTPVRNGETPLHWAARAGSREVVQLLISKGVDVNAKDKRGRTPLDIAVDQGHMEIVELLLQSDSKTNEQDESGRTLRGQAASKLDGEEEIDFTQDAHLPRLDVERGKYGTYLTIRSESISGLLLDVWCYEDRLGDATRYEKQGSTLVLIHKLEEATMTALFEPIQTGVDIQVHVTGPTAEAVQNVRALNPCCQFGRSTAFRSEGNYVDDFVARCFVFLDAGMTLLKDTERIPGTLQGKDDRANYPKPWIQEYFPAWRKHPGQIKGERGYSPDRPVYPIIGVVSRDRKYLAAIAWPETSSLGQVWHHCIHPRPLIAESFDTKTGEIRSCGKIYLMENDGEKLLRRFKEDFPHWLRPPDVR